MALLQANAVNINTLIHGYEPKCSLNVYEGLRKTLPVDAFPSLEIEPEPVANEWGSCRAQRPRFTFSCYLTVRVSNQQFGSEYVCSLATRILEIMTNPKNLQFRIVNETHWTPFGGLVDTYATDSGVESCTYGSVHDGSVRVAQWDWFVLVFEPYPDSAFALGDWRTPTIIRPKVIAA